MNSCSPGWVQSPPSPSLLGHPMCPVGRPEDPQGEALVSNVWPVAILASRLA